MYQFNVSLVGDKQYGGMGPKPRLTVETGNPFADDDSDTFDDLPDYMRTAPREKVKQTTLADIYEKDLDGQPGYKARIFYLYDFRDNWYHELAYLGKANPAIEQPMGIQMGIKKGQKIVCLSGEGRPAVEHTHDDDPEIDDLYEWDITQVNKLLKKIKC